MTFHLICLGTVCSHCVSWSNAVRIPTEKQKISLKQNLKKVPFPNYSQVLNHAVIQRIHKSFIQSDLADGRVVCTSQSSCINGRLDKRSSWYELANGRSSDIREIVARAVNNVTLITRRSCRGNCRPTPVQALASRFSSQLGTHYRPWQLSYLQLLTLGQKGVVAL